MFQQFHLNQTQLNHCTTKFEFYQDVLSFCNSVNVHIL
nr:MAG TPA: hypothetical protein [Caudoviricetes sp.]